MAHQPTDPDRLPPDDWDWNRAEMTPASTWQDWEDDRPSETRPIQEGLAEGLRAAIDRAWSERR